MAFRLVRALRLARTAPIVLWASFALGACGLGPGPTPKGVSLVVTRDFGARSLLKTRAPKVRGQETVMSFLARNASVGTRYGGGFVESIDGLSGGSEGGEPVDWFYYVNGLEATRGAAEANLHPGERIWWDRHDWSQTEDVPAVVGSFPEPFLTGIAGKRLPVRVECVAPASSACQKALARLRAVGVPAALSAISGAYSPQTLRVVVGPFTSISGEVSAHRLQQGPRTSGVYARFAADGATLTLLDADGHAARLLGRGAGLIAATRQGEDAPVWLLTGTDSTGVERAARALDEVSLEDRFAVALPAAGPAVALPDRGS